MLWKEARRLLCIVGEVGPALLAMWAAGGGPGETGDGERGREEVGVVGEVGEGGDDVVVFAALAAAAGAAGMVAIVLVILAGVVGDSGGVIVPAVASAVVVVLVLAMAAVSFASWLSRSAEETGPVCGAGLDNERGVGEGGAGEAAASIAVTASWPQEGLAPFTSCIVFFLFVTLGILVRILPSVPHHRGMKSAG